MGKKKSESNESLSPPIQQQQAQFMPLDLINTIINNKKEEIRTYRTIIASTIIAAIAIPLGIIAIGNPDVLKKNLWVIPKPGLWILGLWVIGFGLLFFGVWSFLSAGKFSREGDFNLRLIRAWDRLVIGDTTEANRELREGLEESTKFLDEGKNALRWALFAMLPFLISVVFVSLAIIFGGQ